MRLFGNHDFLLFSIQSRARQRNDNAHAAENQFKPFIYSQMRCSFQLIIDAVRAAFVIQLHHAVRIDGQFGMQAGHGTVWNHDVATVATSDRAWIFRDAEIRHRFSFNAIAQVSHR